MYAPIFTGQLPPALLITWISLMPGVPGLYMHSELTLATMNKWFWIDGQSNDLAAGKKGAKIDPAKRKFIALNVKVNRTKGSNGKYTWRLDCNNCCKSK